MQFLNLTINGKSKMQISSSGTSHSFSKNLCWRKHKSFPGQNLQWSLILVKLQYPIRKLQLVSFGKIITFIYCCLYTFFCKLVFIWSNILKKQEHYYLWRSPSLVEFHSFNESFCTEFCLPTNKIASK